MSNIKHICIGSRHGVAKECVKQAELIAGYGVEGDIHAGQNHHHVSLIAAEDLQAAKFAIKPGRLGENIMLHGVDLNKLGIGSRLYLGDRVVLNVTQTGKTLQQPDNIVPVTGDYLMARYGVFAQIECGGTIRANDTVRVESLVPREQYQAVVLTISDRCSKGETVDTAGPAVAATLEESLNAHVYHSEIVPDDESMIVDKLRYYCDNYSIDLLLTVGGTGPAPRDVTPEASRRVIQRFTPGIDEAMRYASLAKTPFAMLSRGVSGIRGSTWIVNLPGSERGSVENLEAIIKALPHGLKKLRGHPADCDCCRPRTVTPKVASGQA